MCDDVNIVVYSWRHIKRRDLSAKTVRSCRFLYIYFLEEKIVFYFKEKETVLSELHTDFSCGLSQAEADARLETYGKNKLKEKKKKSLFARFLEQFKDVMIIILIIAAIVSFVVACVEGNPKEFFEPVLILFIVILNAVMGVFQENKAEKSLEALQKITAQFAKVIRDGSETLIDASLLVPGDIIRLEAGDFIPADARLIESSSLKSEESALTGESVPSDKDALATVDENAPLGDRINMVYSGCTVTYGTAFAVVTATGMNTEMGKIANLLDNEIDTKTPLKQKLASLGKILGIVALAACAIIFVIGILNDINPLEIFMTSVSLAVSAIPEGLPAIVTIVLSIGVQRMVKRGALIRKLPAVETLGSASIICSDKTGTLTQNRMTLVKAYTNTGIFEDINDSNSNDVKKLLEYATLCCDGSVQVVDGNLEHIGDPTETAIIVASMNNGKTKEELNAAFPRLAELPFDSDRKLMTTVNDFGDKKVVIVKGAFDVLATKCVSGNIQKAKLITDQMSSDALRVLAVAYKEINDLPSEISSETLENVLEFMGLVGMIDPPREEVKEAVAVCRNAGIKPIMITGDHIVTATAIAKQLGIFLDGDRAILGTELDAMSEEELDASVESISVYARVSPENKIRIVKAWQKKGHVVSMTGDGVNDAPALKAADIGCAMGITGTDVAKSASDMTLTDDNFATIVEAVREGRGIYDNIKKVVGFLLGTNIGEVITVFISMLLWHKSPLLSIQLLWINLVTDSLPAIALGTEAVETEIMQRKPRPKNEGIFANGLGIKVILQGIMFAVLTLTAFKIGETNLGLAAGQTMAFIVLAVSQIIQSYNMRSNHSLFKIGFFTNKTLNGATAISLGLVLLIVFSPLGIPFGMKTLNLNLYLIAFGLALIPLLLLQTIKVIGDIKKR